MGAQRTNTVRFAGPADCGDEHHGNSDGYDREHPPSRGLCLPKHGRTVPQWGGGAVAFVQKGTCFACISSSSQVDACPNTLLTCPSRDVPAPTGAPVPSPNRGSSSV